MATMWLAVVTRVTGDEWFYDEQVYGVFSSMEKAQAALDAEIDGPLEVCHPNWVDGEIRSTSSMVSVAEVYVDAQHAGNETARRSAEHTIVNDEKCVEWSPWKPVGV